MLPSVPQHFEMSDVLNVLCMCPKSPNSTKQQTSQIHGRNILLWTNLFSFNSPFFFFCPPPLFFFFASSLQFLQAPLLFLFSPSLFTFLLPSSFPLSPLLLREWRYVISRDLPLQLSWQSAHQLQVGANEGSSTGQLLLHCPLAPMY